MDFMKHSYSSYFIMDEAGVCQPCKREDCFAPSYDERQRWYWDGEHRSFIIRLPLTEYGIRIGNAHLAGLKKDQRDLITKLQCIYFGTPRCGVTCEDCDYKSKCASKQRNSNGLKCRQKCHACPSYVCNTVELDMQITSDCGQTYSPFEPASGADTASEAEELAEIEALMTALKALSEKQQQLVRDIFWAEMTERELAPLLGLKSSKTINYRKQVILDILRSDKLLKSFFEIL